MFYSRKLSSRIKHLHERCLRTVYSDRSCSYKELLKKGGSILIRCKSVQTFAVEMFKILKGVSRQLMTEVFLL